METDHSHTPWTIEGVKRLQALWHEGVAPEIIAQAMHRPEPEVRAKARELKLANQPVTPRS